jgi:hypothetical protein
MSRLALRKKAKDDCDAFYHKPFLSFSRKVGSCSWINKKRNRLVQLFEKGSTLSAKVLYCSSSAHFISL